MTMSRVFGNQIDRAVHKAEDLAAEQPNNPKVITLTRQVQAIKESYEILKGETTA